MSDAAKPPAVRINEDRAIEPTPAIVKTHDGEKWAADHIEKREGYLRIVNYETNDCQTVREVVDIPHRRVWAIQRYPLAEDQEELLGREYEGDLIPDGGTDDLEERVTELERKMEHVTAHNRCDTAPEGRR